MTGEKALSEKMYALHLEMEEKERADRRQRDSQQLELDRAVRERESARAPRVVGRARHTERARRRAPERRAPTAGRFATAAIRHGGSEFAGCLLHSGTQLRLYTIAVVLRIQPYAEALASNREWSIELQCPRRSRREEL